MSSLNRAALALAVAVAGCAAGPNFERPAPPSIPTFLMAGDEPGGAGAIAAAAPKAAGPWWRAFDDAKLDAVMAQALANNDQLALADATLSAARAQERAAFGDALPRVDANGSTVRERINTTAFGFTGFPSPTISLYSIGAAINYDLDPFGAKRRRVESARARAEGAQRRAAAAYLTLTGRVASQAFLIAALRAQLARQNAIVGEDRTNYDDARRAEAAGGAARTATQSADTQLAQDLAALPALERQLEQARHGLALLVGKAPGDWTAPDFELSDFTLPARAPLTLPSALVRSRPDIAAAEADLHAATADIGVASAELYPDLALSASLTQTAIAATKLFSPASSGWVVGPALSAPLFHGGALRANRRAAQARADAALATYKQTVLEAFVQVADLLVACARDGEEVKALAGAESTAASRLQTARLGFERGGLAYLDVLDAQRQHDRVALDLAAAQGRRLTDMALLYVATAADWRQDHD